MKKIMDKIYSPKVIYVYVLLFPIFEIITSFMVRQDIHFTFGMVYKTIFIVYATFYILFCSKSNKKINLIYIAALFITIIMCALVTSGFDIKNIDAKLFKGISKFLNLPIMLVFFYTYFKDCKKFNTDIFEYSIVIYCISILIAVITKTSEPTYLLVDNTIKLGFKGWLFAGNEIGNLLGIMYPIAIYLASVKKKKIYLLMLAIITFCTAEVGTKTATLSLAITVVVCLVFCIVMSFIRKDENIIKARRISLILLVLLAIYAPFSTSYKIIKIRMTEAKQMSLNDILLEDLTGKENLKESAKTPLENVNDISSDEKETQNNVIQQAIYSGRQDFKKYQSERFKESKIINKLFGLKNDGAINIEGIGEFEIVERDFHDILYMYGIIGSAIFFAPVVYMLGASIYNAIKNIKKIDLKIVTYAVSIILAFSIAYIAGHVLLTPAIAMFLSSSLAMITLYTQNIEEKLSEKKT